MADIRIETITPVHIGSGRELNANTEYIIFQVETEDGPQPHLAVLDENKVLEIIGPENVNKWVNLIDNNQSLKPYLEKRKPDIQYPEVARRVVPAYAYQPGQNRTMKEQMFDGRGLPYIPGSSIKGAIRTAVLAHYARQQPDFAARNLKGKRGFTGEVLEKKLFGNNPNESVFRFLYTGDAYFGQDPELYQTLALKAEIFNQFRGGWDIKSGGAQLLEAIPEEDSSTFRLMINTTQLDKNKLRGKTDFLNLEKLFSIINTHTKTLLKRELNFWDEQEVDAVVFTDYREFLENTLEKAQDCNNNEAVLRIGYGSGWDFITGGWAAEVMSENEYEEFLQKVRKQFKYDTDVPFPKTRTMGDEGDIFGFVKLRY